MVTIFGCSTHMKCANFNWCGKNYKINEHRFQLSDYYLNIVLIHAIMYVVLRILYTTDAIVYKLHSIFYKDIASYGKKRLWKAHSITCLYNNYNGDIYSPILGINLF